MEQRDVPATDHPPVDPDPDPDPDTDLEQDAWDARLRLISWGLITVSLVFLVLRSVLDAQGTPIGWTAPLAFWPPVIAALGVQGWRARNRIKAPLPFVSGIALAVVAAEVGAILTWLNRPGRTASSAGQWLLLAAFGVTALAFALAGPASPGRPGKR
jgi:hypothetical protein